MFTGFASENTPAIQVWDFSKSYSGDPYISLTDDCAPIQYFKVGGSSSAFNEISVRLPTSPIEGKQIKFVASRYGTNSNFIGIFSSDVTGSADQYVYTVAVGQTVDLIYSKEFISFGSSSGLRRSGWVCLDQSPVSSASNFSKLINGYISKATGIYSIGSGYFNTTSGDYASIIGGQSNTSSNTNSFVGGGSSNTASGQNSAVIGGQGNGAQAQDSAVIGAGGSTASGVRSVALACQTSGASGTNSFVGGGSIHTANATNSTVVGGSYGTTRSIQGNTVLPASTNPITTTQGVSQSALLVLGTQTTDATATRLRSNTSAATTTNQVILPNNSAYTFQGTCIANVTGGSTTSGWKYEGVIKRGANAASTTLVAAVTPTVIAQDVAAATWVLAITADTTNGGIAVTVTGAAATTIRWVSRIETTEVTF